MLKSYFFHLLLVYIEVGPDVGASAALAWTYGTSTTVSRIFEVKVTQLECWNESRPYDVGCLQYHVGAQGRLTTFNFAQSSSSLYAHLPSQE